MIMVEGKEKHSSEKERWESESNKELLAARIYVLMKKDFRISRTTRARWYFHILPSRLSVSKYESIHDLNGELDVVSVVPKDPDPDWDWDIGHLYSYRVSSSSEVSFLAQRYRFVFLLDISPSLRSVDPYNNDVSSILILPALQKTLEGIRRPFYVPGSQLLLTPEIYITVIAWTPFLVHESQKILHQGFLLRSDNIEECMQSIILSLRRLSERICFLNQRLIKGKRPKEEKSLFASLFDEPEEKETSDETRREGKEKDSEIPIATPDAGFINMIGTGILALALLPKRSSAGIIVISDGMFSVPDMNICDSLLNQLRSNTISLSFLQVSSGYHPQCGFGRLPYFELMEFLSCATYGTYLSKVPDLKYEQYVYDMNIFHEAFLCWSFRKALKGIQSPSSSQSFDKRTQNVFFLNSSEDSIKKKMYESTIGVRLSSLLSVRLGEGYTINSMSLHSQKIEIKLTLPWKIRAFLHYVVVAPWPQTEESSSRLPSTEISVYLEGTYDTLHDIICQKNKIHSSKDRNSVTRKFYLALQNIAHVDKLLCHLESFHGNSSHYNLPDALANGVPLFHTQMTFSSSLDYFRPEFSGTSFAAFWKPINSLDFNVWHRWMHSNRIHILLQHDYPLPRHLFLANSSGRYTSVQCRKSALKLFDLLKEISSFILMENSSYVSFVKSENDPEGPPSSFIIIRVTCKPPCVVLWLAFPSTISGSLRHKIQHQLILKLDELRIKQHTLSGRSNTYLAQPSEVKSTNILLKPIERILIRYENIPQNYLSLFEFSLKSDNTINSSSNSLCTSSDKGSNGTFLSLARYLYHRRWIWSLVGLSFISPHCLGRILHVLAKSRLLEGFTFAHSMLGIQNMAVELPLINQYKSSVSQQSVIQYIIFPPHSFISSDAVVLKDEGREKEEGETEMSHEIISEVWVEPQNGVIEDGLETRSHFNGCNYSQIPDVLYVRDYELLSSLYTYEYLSSILKSSPSSSVSSIRVSESIDGAESSIISISLSIELVNLLVRSPHIELILSTYIQNLDESFSHSNHLLYSSLCNRIMKINDYELSISKTLQDSLFSFLFSTPRHLVSQGKERDKKCRETNSKIQFRVFVKSVNNKESLLLTILPKSLEDLKALSLFNFVEKEMGFRERSSGGSGKFPRTDSETHNPYNKENETEEERKDLYTIKRRLSRSYRERSGSMDKYSLSSQYDQRFRTCSLDSKELAPVRPRSSTTNTMNRPKISSRTPVFEPSVFGSYTLPLYLYHVVLSELTNDLLFHRGSSSSSSSSTTTTSFLDLRFNSSSSEESSSQVRKTNNNIRIINKALRNYTLNTTNSYYESFIQNLTCSLESRQITHRLDVMNALSKCNYETCIPIDLTEFLNFICIHQRYTDCQYSMRNGESLQRKFLQILNTSFTFVPEFKDLLFFDSDKVNESRKYVEASSMNKSETEERCRQEKEEGKESHLHQCNSHSKEETDYSQSKNTSFDSLTTPTPTTNSRCRCSHPLFLQVSLTLYRRTEEGFVVIPYSGALPTCWKEILSENEHFYDSLSLNVILISWLPSSEETSSESTEKNEKEKENDDENEENVLLRNSSSTSSETLQTFSYLPKAQRNAITSLLETLEWTLQNEESLSLTKYFSSSSSFPSSDNLKRVIRHIESSVSRPGCFCTSLPLFFALHSSKSYEIFKEELLHCTLCYNCKIKKKDEYLIVCRDENETDVSECWLIARPTPEAALIYFQIREEDVETEKFWRQVFNSLSFAISETIKSVNIKMLLEDLNETRIMNEVLVTFKKCQNDEPPPMSGETQKTHFVLPLVMNTTLRLHPRLKASSSESSLSNGLRSLTHILNPFTIHNRANHFVYKDESSDIYIISLSEERDLEMIELRVYGLSNPKNDIRTDLIVTLQKELNQTVVEVISEILSRNPKCKLSQEDVIFLQDPQSEPSIILHYYLSPVISFGIQKIFKEILRQHKPLFIVPKYLNTETQFIGEESETSDILLYNRGPYFGRIKGLAVLNILVTERENDANFESESFDELTTPLCGSSTTNTSFEFKIWKQGRLEDGKLEETLTTALKISIWEWVTKAFFLSQISKQKVITPWLTFGKEIVKTPYLSLNSLRLPFRYSSSALSLEIKKLIIFLFPFFKIKLIVNDEVLWNSLVDFDHSYYIVALFSVETKSDDLTSSASPSSSPSSFQSTSFPYSSSFIIFEISSPLLVYYTYNLKKESFDKLYGSLNALCHWTSARSFLGTTIVSQKLGLFHNQKFGGRSRDFLLFSDGVKVFNPFTANPGKLIEQLIKQSSPPQDFKIPSGESFSISSIYKNSKPLKPIQSCAYSIEKDSTGRFGRQLLDMKNEQKREIIKKLCEIWQDCGQSSLSSFSEESLLHFKKISRLSHFVLSPLLFLPSWRAMAHSTRVFLSSPLFKVTTTSGQDKAHDQLLANYVQEYIQYLHTLGFLMVKNGGSGFGCGSSDSRITNNKTIKVSSCSPGGFFQRERSGSSSRRAASSVKNYSLYHLQKSLAGGLVVFEIGILPPFFYSKLYGIEARRLLLFSETPFRLNNESMVDEMDKIKILLHLHSYTYDYHLRTIHNYISGRPHILPKDFQILHFIDFFMTYYNKSPNFARSLLAAHKVSISSPLVSSDSLYRYLYTHEKGYDLKVLHCEGETHPLLFRIFPTNDDYEFSLLLRHDEFLKNELTLKIILILTPKRELFPTVSFDKSKGGQFRTISQLNKLSSLDILSQSEENGEEKEESEEERIFKYPDEDYNEEEFRREDINYVGYFTAREQMLQNMIIIKSMEVETMLKDIFERARIHCRRDFLWQGLAPSAQVSLTFPEFLELLTLVDIEPLKQELFPMVTRPVSWYQSLMKVMIGRYPNSYRLFGSSDGSTVHCVIQDHPDTCALISIELNSQETSLNIIFKEHTDFDASHKVIEDFIAVCLHHVWMGLL